MVYFAVGFALLVVGFIVTVFVFSLLGLKKARDVDNQLLAQIAHDARLRCDRGIIWGNLRGRSVRARLIGVNASAFCVEVPFDPPLDLGLTLQSRDSDHYFDNGNLPPPFSVEGGQDFQTGEPQLDRAFRVRADEPARVRALLSPELRGLLFTDLDKHAAIRLSDQGVEIRDAADISDRHASGRSMRDSATLAFRIELAVRIAEAIERAQASVPTATALAPQLHTWRALSQSTSLQGSTTPLAVWGTLENVSVWAYARRLSTARYQLIVQLRFASSLELGMTLCAERQGAYKAWDVQLSDPAFDQAFHVQLANSELAQQVLSAEARRGLLEIHQELGSIYLDDTGLQVHLPTSIDDPSRVPKIVQRAAPVLNRIWQNVAATRGAGPYR